MRGGMRLVILLSVLLAGCPGAPPPAVALGGSIDEAALRSARGSFEAMRTAKPGAEVVLEGTVGKVCPAGCWFYLHAAEDLVYVDVLGDFKVPQEASGRTAMVKGLTDGEGGSRIVKAQRVLLSAGGAP